MGRAFLDRKTAFWFLAALLFFPTLSAYANQLSWKTLAPLPSATSRGSSGVVGNRIFILGGVTASGTTAAVQMYDPANNSWQAKPSLIEPRHDGAEATLGNIVYIAGGLGAPGSESSVLAYDTTSGLSSVVGSLVTQRTGAGAAIVNNKLYVIGGSTAESDSIEEFDLGTKTAIIKRSLPAARQWASVVALNNRIYIIGGLDSSGSAVADCWEYDPATNLLTDRRLMPVALASKGIATANGKIYVIGGLTGLSTSLAWTPAIRLFDPAANRWEAVGYLRTSRQGSAAAVIGTSLYVTGGDNGSQVPNFLDVHETAPLAPAGTIWSWTDGTTPATEIAGTEGIVAIAQGDDHRVALKHDGTVLTWGANGAGQLGRDGEFTAPGSVPELAQGVAVAAGKAHTSVLTASGTVWEYGNYRSRPRMFADTGFVALSGGDYYTVALKGDGTVWTWTYDGSPEQVPGLANIAAIAAGRSFSSDNTTELALAIDGTVWGWNIYNPSPVAVNGLANVIAIANNGTSSSALKGDWTVWRWSNGTPLEQVPGLSGVIDLTTGSALDADSSVWDWSNPAAPSQISGLSGAFAITANMAILPYITPIILPSQMPSGTRGNSYSHSLSVFGAIFPYTCSLASGTLPPGLALQGGTCTITGTPLELGSYSFTLQSIDAAGMLAAKEISMAVYEPLAITTSTLPVASVSRPYSTTLSSAGGEAPYRWRLVSGELPGGLTIESSTGLISGTPLSAGIFYVTVNVTDASIRTASQTLALTVKGIINIPELPPSDYPSIQAAYDASLNGGTIELLAVEFYELLSCNRNITVSLKGGYGSSGYTTVHGSITVTDGTVTLDNFVIM